MLINFEYNIVVGGCSVVAILRWQIWSVLTVCRNCGVHEQWWVCMVCWRNVIAAADMVVFYVEDCGVRNAEYRLVHSVHTNRLSACREFCGVHSWQNGTRCRYGVKVLWCHSHLVWLVFEDSIPTSVHSENFICDLFLLLFFSCCTVVKREERWEGRPRGRSMVYKLW